MANYNNHGAFKVTSVGPTVSYSGSVVATNVSRIEVTGSHNPFVGASNGTVTFLNTGHAPIMPVTGFSNSMTPADRNFYFVSSSGFFSGGDEFAMACLYRSKARHAETLLCGIQDDYLGTGWGLWHPGFSHYTASAVDGQVKTVGFPIDTANMILPNPSEGKWIFALMTVSLLNQEMNIWVNGINTVIQPLSDVVLDVPTNISFSVGASNMGDTFANRANMVEIAAVALKTGSFDTNIYTHFNMYENVVRDGDINQDPNFQWDHIWSAKSNPPDAFWQPSVGDIPLVRSGTLAIVTNSCPRWL